jgi:hypothetical protein
MRAHHFVLREALDALRAHVPVGDLALRRQHVQGIIRHALHQQAEMLLALAQRFLRGAAFRDVARDLGEAEQRAIGRADRVEHDAGPEARAVVAHAPAFAFEAAFVARRGQRPFGQAGGTVLVRIETREVLAHDLVGLVTLEALGASIPAADVAFRVQHVDRVVADAGHQQLVALLEVWQGRLSRRLQGDRD